MPMLENYIEEDNFIDPEQSDHELFHTHVIKDDHDLITIDEMLKSSFNEFE